MKRARAVVVLAVVALTLLQQQSGVHAGGASESYLQLANGLYPMERDAFDAGRLGVVPPMMARRYLAHAYRVLSNRPPIAGGLDYQRPYPIGFSDRPDQAWLDLSDSVLGVQVPEEKRRWRWFDRTKYLDGFGGIENCSIDALAVATATLQDRITRFGRSSDIVRNWTGGQLDVFSNCAGNTLKLPPEVPATAHPLLRADRAYQIAAAHFYAMQYDEAARRFRAIAEDRSSPWQPFGRYLAARALIRKATVPVEQPDAAVLAEAEKELRVVLADTGAARLHSSARGLLDFIDVRLRLRDKLTTVSEALAAPEATAPMIVDFEWMMDRLVGDTVDYAYDSIEGIDSVRTEDLVDWVLAFQGKGAAATDRVVTRWQQTRSLPWLIALMWKLDGPHPAAGAALDAAAKVPPDSPGYETLMYLRPRLLIALGRHADARALLASFPSEPAAGVQRGTSNLLRSLRLGLAQSLVAFWRNAPRHAVFRDYSAARRPDGSVQNTVTTRTVTLLDRDSTDVVNRGLPLTRLVDAALMPELGPHIRRRLAVMALTRAIILGRDDEGLRVAPVLRQLSAPLAADLNEYIAATTAIERQRKGLLLLLRTPGMWTTVPEGETTFTTAEPFPARGFEIYSHTWWCVADEDPARPLPAFLAAADLKAAAAERARMSDAGNASVFMGTAVLKWARQAPSHPDLAEALARLIRAWRRSCRDNTGAIPQRAFQLLHRHFPGSEWAKRTKYWYR